MNIMQTESCGTNLMQLGTPMSYTTLVKLHTNPRSFVQI